MIYLHFHINYTVKLSVVLTKATHLEQRFRIRKFKFEFSDTSRLIIMGSLKNRWNKKINLKMQWNLPVQSPPRTKFNSIRSVLNLRPFRNQPSWTPSMSDKFFERKYNKFLFFKNAWRRVYQKMSPKGALFLKFLN